MDLTSLTDEQWRVYRDELARIVGCAWYQSVLLLRATEEQKAKALAAVLNKSDNP